jgi:hypothetical protein
MVRRIAAETELTDFNAGSVIVTLLEAAAISDYQNQISILKILESSRLESLVGSDLDTKAIEMNIPNGQGGIGRIPATRSGGTVTVGSGFTKKSSTFYLGKPAPYSGGLSLYLQDAEGWPASGQVYIGRGSGNEEGPLTYTALSDQGTYFALTLSPSNPLLKAHRYDEQVVLSQGGVRTVPAGTRLLSPAVDNTPQVEFVTDGALTLLDGESTGQVRATCTRFGEEGNVVAGAITVFASVPFLGATVSNDLAFVNGAASENDEQLRQRIKNYPATLSKGTSSAIAAALQNLRDPVSGKTITSLNIVEPTSFGEPARCFIDDGSGLEPSVAGQPYEDLLASANGQEVLFKTAKAPVTACLAIGTELGPYQLTDGDVITISLDDVTEAFTVRSADFANINAVSAAEIVNSFNSQGTNVAFRTASGGKAISVFDLSGRGEVLKIDAGSVQEKLGLPTREIRPLYLFRNNELLSFKGKTATLTTSAYPWFNQGSLTLVSVKIDGVQQTFTINDFDFQPYGTTLGTASLSHWASVLKKKIAGVNIYPVTVSGGGSALVWETWQENSAEGSIEITYDADWFGVGSMWGTESASLLSVGAGADYEFNRLLGQIRLLEKPSAGDSISLASEQTRAMLVSTESDTGVFPSGISLTVGNPRFIVGVDGDFALRAVAYPSGAVFTVIAGAEANFVRLTINEFNVIANIQVGDYVSLVRDTTSGYSPVPASCVGTFKVKQVGGTLLSGGYIEIQMSTDQVADFIAAATFSVTATTFSAFKCDSAVPQIVDMGTNTTLTTDQVATICDPQLTGASVIKLTPQQFAIRSDNFSENKSIAIFDVIGSAKGFLSTGISTSIQSHVGAQNSGDVYGGFAKVQGVVGNTYPNAYYPQRGYLFVERVHTDIVDQAENPAIEMAASVIGYPIGLQEVAITGTNTGNVIRVYNNNATAPFSGFARGDGVFKPQKQSTVEPSDLSSNVGLRLEDLPFGFNDKFVVEMNQDAVSGASAVPIYKKANIWTLDPVTGGKGSLIKFTLTDPEDNDLYFFDPASPYRDFDFSDFNIWFKSIGLHHVYPENTLTKLPDFTQKNTLLFQSREFGPAHRPRVSIIYGREPNLSAPTLTHKSFVENQVSICDVYVILPTGPLHGSYTGTYDINFANYSGNGGSALAEMTLTATVGDINTGGTQFRVGDILSIGGSGDYTGAFLITSATAAEIKAVAPGIRKTGYTQVTWDTAQNPLRCIEKADFTMAQLATALTDYFVDNPILTARVISVDDTVKVLYPTYFTQGNPTENLSLTSMGESFDYHGASGHYGSLAQIYLYRRLDELNAVVDEIRALSQYDDPMLLAASEIEPTMNYVYRGEECVLVPATATALQRWLNFASVSSLPLRAEVSLVDTSRRIQINSQERGSAGAVKVTGITANGVSDTFKSVPWSSSGGLMGCNISHVLAQSTPRGTLVEVTNDFANQVGRAYTSAPVSVSGTAYSVITPSNDSRIDVFFRDTTWVSYSHPSVIDPVMFVFHRSASGYSVGGLNSVVVTKVNPFVARISVPGGNNNVLRARLGDMMVISPASAALSDNRCIALAGTWHSDIYPGYPVVHIASETEIYVIGPNLVDDTFSLSSDNDVMFVPHVKNEKNIRSNYKSGAKFQELINPGEGLYYRIKPIGGGFVYAEFSNDTDGNNLDMQLDGMSVSTDDWVTFSKAFLPANRGSFRIVAHDGKNAIVFMNPSAVEELLRADSVAPDSYGTDYWGKGPLTDADLLGLDKRHVRIWDTNGVKLSDLMVISPAVTTGSTWFSSDLIGSWSVIEIGLTGSANAEGAYHVYVQIDLPNAPTTQPDVLLSGSASALSFYERELASGESRVVGYKWVAGYTPSALDPEFADLYLAPNTSLKKMLPEYGTKLNALFKTSFLVTTQTGVDAYQYYTELISEAHKVLDGSAENPIDYPGVRAAGSQVEVLAPLVKSIYLGLEILPKEGVTISSIKAPVRSVISSYINTLGVGREVVLSEVIKRVQQVPGVKSITIVNSSPDAASGVISVGSFEVARVLDPNNISI